MSANQATLSLARWSATHPIRALAGWVAFVAICFVLGGAFGTTQASNDQLGTGESGRAAAITRSASLNDPASENVLITARSGPLDQASAIRTATTIAQSLKAKTDAVAAVSDPIPARNGTAVLVTATIVGPAADAGDHLGPITAVAADAQRAHPELRVETVGSASIDQGVNDELGRSFGRASTISLPVTLVILAVAFGAIVAAGVPVILALCSVFAAIGLSSLASHVLPSTPTINEVILLMGMAVGVDYSLFYLKREREERARGRDRRAAIEIAAATAGHSVLVSGFAVMVSMAGLYIAGDVSFASLATGSIIVVAVAMLGSLTVLPALLAVLGRAVDRPRVPVLWRLTNRPARTPRLWPALLQPALRRPGITATLALAAMLALAAPALTLSLHSSGVDDLPRTIPALQAYDRLTAAYPSQGPAHLVVVRAPSQDAERVEADLRSLANAAARNPLFAVDPQSISIAESADQRVHTLELPTPETGSSTAGRHSLTVLRRDLVPAAFGGTSGVTNGVQVAVGGDIANDVDYARHSMAALPWVMAFVLGLTLVMMAVTFRSIVIALTAIAVNLLSAGASFGVLVLVFQRHWAQSMLDFRTTGVIAWIPMFMFVVLFGLSMDYHVLLVSRIREAAASGMPIRDAVRYGVTRSAGVVTSAAIVMVSVFAVFATLSMVEFKQLGIGLSVAVLLDVLVVRIVLLPALMILLGRWNWWPGRIGPRVSVAAPVARIGTRLPDHAEPARV